MAASAGFGRRLRHAYKWLDFSMPAENITQEKFGDMVAAELGRSGPFTQGAVGNWMKGAVPDIDTIEAMANVLGVRAAWLAFGEEPMTEKGTPGLSHVEYNVRPPDERYVAELNAEARKRPKKRKGRG